MDGSKVKPTPEILGLVDGAIRPHIEEVRTHSIVAAIAGDDERTDYYSRLIPAACNAVQEAGIPLEALEQRPTLIRDMVEALKTRPVQHREGCFGSYSNGPCDCWERQRKAVLAQVEKGA